MHLLFATGIVGVFAERHRAAELSVFTLLPALGVGEELRGEAVSANEVVPEESPRLLQNKILPSAETLEKPTRAPSALTDASPCVAACAEGQAPRLGGAVAAEDAAAGILTPPVALRQARPARPSSAGGGRVIVSFTITEEGRVARPVVESATSEALSGEVLAVLPRWRFQPASQNGRATALRVRQVVEF